jgi:RNA polymerase sigma factor (sigma-70 family)
MIGDINAMNQGKDDAKLVLLEDSDLLRRYAADGLEAAFAELVRRRIGLVYAVALRQTRGDRHRAQDATQAVFTDLARKAASLARRPVLVGWLHRSAQFAAAGLIRAEQRRRAREQEAHTMEKTSASDAPAPDWDKLRPLLDEALNEMDERDRDAILLRYFDDRPFAEIGGRLRLTEGAARMRVERALAKLHAALARRGVTSTAAALGVALGQQVGAAVPTGLAATVTGGALAASAAGAGGWLATFMGMTKLQAVIAGGVVVAGTVGFISQATTNADLRREIAVQRESQQTVTTLREENRRLASTAAEVEALRRDDAEYQRLAQRAAEAQKANAENTRLARQRDAARDLKAFEAQSIAELNRLNLEGNALVLEYKALMDRSQDTALTAEERAQADVAAKRKLAEIQMKQREIQAYIAARSKEHEALVAQLRAAGLLPIDRAPSQNEFGSTGRTMPDGQQGFYYVSSQATDLSDALSAYEKLSGIKVIRDPSLVGARATLNLPAAVVRPESEEGVLHLSRAGVGLEKGAAMSPEETVRAIQAALRDQVNVVLEPGSDGTLVAKLGPPR